MQKIQREVAPCKHVFHLAGVLPDSGQVPAVRDLRWSDCAPVLRPKVEASVYLAAAGDAELPPDWNLVCFSSVFGLLGYPRLAPYAAANSFQDGFAERRAHLGHQALAVAWGAWGETGMAHRTGAGFHAFWRSEGMDFIPLKTGMDVLGCILGMQSRPSCISVLPSLAPGVWPVGLRRHPLARGIAAEPEAETHALADVGEVEADDAQEDMPTVDVRALVAQLLGTLLRQDENEVPFDEPFAAIGLTSMMAVDLSARLGQALGTTLPATLAFEMVDADQLCEALQDRLRPRRRGGRSGAARADPVVDAAVLHAASGPTEARAMGVACMLPGGSRGSSADAAELWRALLDGHDCVRQPPSGRPVAPT